MSDEKPTKFIIDGHEIELGQDEIPESLKKLVGEQEELHPDLKPYLGEAESLGTCLRHPLVFAVPYIELWNARYNEQYRHKCEYRDKAFNEGNWGSYIFIHEKPYRVEALYELERDHGDVVPDEEFWKMFGEVWTNIENMWQMDDEIRELLDMAQFHKRKKKKSMMDDDELALLDSLPNQFVVYRGHQLINDWGLSWTLSPWRAKWFANRWSDPNATVTRATIRKANVIGLFLGRSEMEVGAIPEFLEHVEEMTFEYPPHIQEMFDLAIDRFQLSTNSYHGKWHWENVLQNVNAICDETPEADRKVCQLFAIFHDCARENEDEDPQHGPRAVAFLKEIRDKLGLDTKQFTQLFTAIVKHTVGETTDDPTVGVCWDADRLDLPRVNIIPEDKYFSTKAGRQLLWRV